LLLLVLVFEVEFVEEGFWVVDWFPLEGLEGANKVCLVILAKETSWKIKVVKLGCKIPR
jgi:hypothetical protein